MLGATYVFAAIPAALVSRPIDGFDALTVGMFCRRDEGSPLILDFLELAAQEARRP
jgi:hypothetical protein